MSWELAVSDPRRPLKSSFSSHLKANVSLVHVQGRISAPGPLLVPKGQSHARHTAVGERISSGGFPKPVKSACIAPW
jgi:hypothetical protein